jgi:hypothetical protein
MVEFITENKLEARTWKEIQVLLKIISGILTFR